MKDYKLVLSESKIIISGLSLLLKQNGVTPIVKSVIKDKSLDQLIGRGDMLYTQGNEL